MQTEIEGGSGKSVINALGDDCRSEQSAGPFKWTERIRGCVYWAGVSGIRWKMEKCHLLLNGAAGNLL